MKDTFTPVSLEKQAEYAEIIKHCPQATSDYSFANIFGWREHYGLEWAFVNGMVWIRQTKPEVVYWAPVGPWKDYDWENCKCIRETGRFTRVPAVLAEIWKDVFDDIVLEEHRGHFDYVYDVQELIELRGNRFHKKKNLLKQFLKKYDFEYTPMGPECVEEVLEMQAEWYQWYEDNKPSKALEAENHAISTVLKNFDCFKRLLGGTLRVDGKVVAYTVAEPLDSETMVIHFEKGNIKYKGIYQAINQMFLENSGQPFKYVNREQDLDDEGLRKAKLSYHPVHFMEKYEASFK